MSSAFRVGEQVHIFPIDEFGVIEKIRADSNGELIIDVKLNDSGNIHVCRECELISEH